ncbi:MAG: filamentous hemagglutinin N-terminal domain-containing protein, partial [Comamonadaceae bacterium]
MKTSANFAHSLPVRRLLTLLIAAAFDVSAAPPVATALPTGGQVVAGQGSIAQAGAVMTVTQTSTRMVNNWQSFDIGQSAAVNFVQPSASSMVLNRVLSAEPSQIFGNISANGQVFITNPSGVIFGANAQVNVGGLVAASMNLSGDDFLAGRYTFTGPGGAVTNLGQLSAREGGLVALIGATVDNAGNVLAPGGQVALAAGQGARLELGSSGLISVALDAASAAKVQNSGLIAADGGRVLLTANRAAQALGTAINQEGVVRANTLTNRNGEIWLGGGAGDVQVSGQLLALGANGGEKGGKIVVTGEKVTLAAGSLADASGKAGGGQVLVGGGWQGKDVSIAEAKQVVQEAGSLVRVNATENGDGGTAVMWSGTATRISGELAARGAGAGKGGAVETSSRLDLGVASSASVNVGADSGQGGSWLLDPTNVNVASGTGGSVPYAIDTPTVYADTISAALGTSGTSVSIQASGNITVNAAISKIAGAGLSSLTFDAVGNIDVNQAISSSSGQLNLAFGTVAHGLGATTISAPLSTNGGSINFYKLTTLANATPVSTKPGDGVNADAGSVTFFKNVTLAAPAYSVTINTQGAQSGGIYISNGGAVDVQGSIVSGKPGSAGWSPQALTIDSTAASGYTPGAMTLGKLSSDVIGATVADTSLNTNTTGPLRSLTLAGPTTIALKAGSLNFANTSGNVITASTSVAGSPKVELWAPDTVFTLTGGSVAGQTAGYTDLVEDTFNIGVHDASARTLTFNSDRSIKVKNFGVDGVTNAGAATLDVTLNPFQASAATGGAIVMDHASILSNGGLIRLGNAAGTYATGFASDSGGIYDGVNLNNVVLTTAGGQLDIAGKTASSASVSSAGVKISGASTVITTTTGAMNVTGIVQGQTSGNKDGVILGEGGASRITLETSSGKITVLGDASAITAPTGGSRYDGVVVSSGALLRTASGDIGITGSGGGGSQDFITENHGIRLENTNTSIVSGSGNIILTGVSGGKSSATSVGDNSYGIFAKGVDMYIGKDANRSTATGDISFIADSMQFENSGSARLRVASSGELLIKPYSSTTNIEFGTAGSAPIAANGAKTLYLGENWFNGSSIGVFQPGSVVTVSSPSATEQQLSIQGNSGGSFTLTNGTQTTASIGYSATPATLAGNIQSALTAAGMTATVTTNPDSTFKVVFAATQPTLVANATAGFYDLTIGRSDSTGRMTVANATTLRDDLTLLMGTPSTAGRSAIAINAPLTVKQQPNNNSGRTLTLDVGGQGLTAATAGTVAADNLQLLGVGDFVLNGNNLVNTLAANVDGHLDFTNSQGLTVGAVSSHRFTTNSPLTTPTSTTYTNEGVYGPAGAPVADHTAANVTNKNVTLTIGNGDLTLAKNVNAGTGTVSLTAANGAVLETTGAIINADKLYVGSKNTSRLNSDNTINTLAAAISDQGLELKDTSSGLIIGQVPVTARTANSDGTTSIATAVNKNGISASLGKVGLYLTTGDMTQDLTPANSPIKVTGLYLKDDGGNVILENVTNQIGTVTATLASGNNLSIANDTTLTIGGVDTGLPTGGAYSSNGISAVAGRVTLKSVNGAVNEDTAGVTNAVSTADLALDAKTGANLTNTNVVSGKFAAKVSSGNLGFTNNHGNGISIDAVASTSAVINVTGIDVSGAAVLHAKAGDITQNKGVNAGSIGAATSGLLARADAGNVLLNGYPAGTPASYNQIARFAADLGSDGKSVSVRNSGAMVVGTVSSVGLEASYGGVNTKSGDVFLATQNGKLTIARSVDVTNGGNSNGAATIDLRAGGATSDLAIEPESLQAATIRSFTGTIQLLAGQDISTSTANGVHTEILTDGSNNHLMLQAGRNIGSDGNRIEFKEAATLAAQAGGNIWLRKLDSTNNDNLSVGSVAAIHSVDTFGGTASSHDGLVTTANNGNINLNVQAGDLTVLKDVVTNGNGAIDLRSKAGSIAINAATLRSGAAGAGSGTVQLTASGDIKTSTANGVTNEIETTGNALLVSTGGAIGADGQRIETKGVNTLAAQSAGTQWLRQSAGNLTVGSVAALTPGDNAVDIAAANKDGLSTTAANAAINLNVQAGDLTVLKDVVT